MPYGLNSKTNGLVLLFKTIFRARGIKTVFCRPFIRMARMDMNKTAKKFGRLFHVLML